jgi:hypothetical protein
MYDRCPVCGLQYEREPGYFRGAMYFSYLLSIPPALAIVLVLWRWTKWDFDWVMIGAFLCYLPLVPVVTRRARVLWLYIDRHFDP